MSKIQTLHSDSPLFPNNLKQISKPPSKLYCLGDVSLLNSPCIATVGSRDCSDYGLRVAKEFSEGLAKSGITIVSGLAIGIDTACHKGALSANGKTIAVLGCGINNIFPPENIRLANDIVSSGGLIISEYPTSTQYKSEYFPHRNRIVAGLSLGALVVECAYRSGASLTANIAFKQCIPVFCIPTDIYSKHSRC